MDINRDVVFLKHMLHEIAYIERVCAEKSIDDIHADEDLQHMVARAFEIIGEAARNLSLKTKENYPDIPWREMVGVRDRIIHGYFSVNWVIVWDIISNEIPGLKTQLSQVLHNLEIADFGRHSE
ncbi:MAG TPA: DUF86 domain-containing protein [Methanospirillum sp.]|nr:DUF86 domain-containing protein [Methanospirillum sp.]